MLAQADRLRAPRLVGPVATVLLLLSARAAIAGGFAVPEVGARRTGMAATVGRPDEPAAVYHNPAGLTLLDGTRLYVSFGVALIDTKIRLRPWEGSDRFIEVPVDADGYYPSSSPKVALGVIPMLVATTTLWRDRLVGALSFYVPNATGSVLDANGVTRYHLIKGYLVSGLWSASLAFRALPWLSVGASVGVMYLRVYGKRLVYPILPDGEDVSQLLGTKTELILEGSDVQPAWNFGLLARPHPALTLGLTLIGRNGVTLEGPVKVNLGDDALMQTTLSGTQRTGMVIPWTLLAGANWDLTRHVEIGAEARYYFYHEYQRQHTDLQGIEIITELDTPKNYSDSWQVAGGVRVHSLPRVPALEAMLGVHYDVTPAPATTVSLDQPTFDHVGLHTGLRYTFRERYRVGLTYIHYWYVIPRTEGSLTFPPSNYTGRGGNNILSLSFEARVGRGLGR